MVRPLNAPILRSLFDQLSFDIFILVNFAGDWLPCGEYRANELYFGLCALSFNVFALLRHRLPVEWAQSWAPTVRLRLPAGTLVLLVSSIKEKYQIFDTRLLNFQKKNRLSYPHNNLGK